MANETSTLGLSENDSRILHQILAKALGLVSKYLRTKTDTVLFRKLVGKLVKEKEKKLGNFLHPVSIFLMGIIILSPFFLIEALEGFEYGNYLFLVVFIVSIFIGGWLVLYTDKIITKIAKRLVVRESRKTQKEIDFELNDENIYDQLIKKSFDIALADEYRDKIIQALFSEIAVAVILIKDDPIIRDKIKGLVFTIISGSFILESLNLDALVKEEKNLEKLEKVLDEINVSISAMKGKREHLIYESSFSIMSNSIRDINGIIETLHLIELNKGLAVSIDKIVNEIRGQMDEKPIAKSKIKIPKKSIEIRKDKLLSTISVVDSEVLEIRTRAGTYYTTMKFIQKNLPTEIKKMKLLTDKEIEVKIEVLNSTLEMLDEEKEQMSKNDYEKIRNDYFTQLFTAKQVLSKRKGTSSSIKCPYCKTKISPIPQYCKKCKNELPYCIVCLNSIGLGTEVSICPHCKSFAHAEHFSMWLDKSDLCPYCKKEIKGELEVTVIENMTKIGKAR